jgi:neopullulanase
MADMRIRNNLRIINYACLPVRQELRIVILFSIIYFLSSPLVTAQEISIQHVEPPFWWTGFKDNRLQLMVYGKEISKANVSLSYPGVTMQKVNKVENPNYLFLDLVIAPNTKPGKFDITFKINQKKAAQYSYEVLARKPGSATRRGFSSSDVIYLVMPDRFSNGDTTNDNVPGMKQGVKRSDPDERHGGDIRGIIDHLDYIRDIGFTALWINPLLENDQEKYSYHGYSITDYYKIDPRFGNNKDYLSLSGLCHSKGIKLIMDMVFNHCGSGHWWMQDLPSKDWINEWPEFTRTSYRAAILLDPYVSDADSIQFIKGWFDKTMPDLNQHNPFLARYLIQNSIWWIEYAGLDGIRQDTHPYPFKDFMSDWGKAVLNEYPNFKMVGECWLNNPGGIAYWQIDATNRDKYNSYLPCVFDFAMYDALRQGFMEKDGWNTGVCRLYDILTQDFVYPKPSDIVTFADNHDVGRYLTSQDKDIRKLKMAMAFLLTSRGIPEIYYGTEMLLTSDGGQGDGPKRKDFPGGWMKDTVNGFTGAGLTTEQKDFQNYLKKLVNWRKNEEVIHTGQLKHFIPRDGVYVYFRFNDKKTVMVAINNNDTTSKTLDASRYSEFLKDFRSGKEIISGMEVSDLSNLVVPPKSVVIVELKK